MQQSTLGIQISNRL